MERLSGLDASFLYLESSAQLLHVCGVILLDPETIPGGYSYDTFKDELERRIAGVPMFHRKLKQVPLGIDHPVWVDDDDFDIDRHVHRMALPSPGGDAELADLCGHIAGIPLDRSRPLWEFFVIEGLESGKVAVFTKMHHSPWTASPAPTRSPTCAASSRTPRRWRPPPRTRSTASAGRRRAVRPRRGHQPDQAGRWPPSWSAPTAGVLTRTIGRARSGTAMAAPLTAPRTSFNGTITGHRTIAIADISLDEDQGDQERRRGRDRQRRRDHRLRRGAASLPRGARRAARRARWSPRCRSRCAATSKKTAAATRSPRSSPASAPTSRTRSSGWPQVSEGNTNAKDHHKAIPADTLQDWAEFAAPRTFGLAVRVVSSLKLADSGPVIHNLVISNVPGPPVPLYFMGAKIEGLYPLGPIFHGAGLNITVMSSESKMHVGVDRLPRAGARSPGSWPRSSPRSSTRCTPPYGRRPTGEEGSREEDCREEDAAKKAAKKATAKKTRPSGRPRRTPAT